MNEIIQAVVNGVVLPSSCGLIASIIGTLFLRKNTSVEEFEKLKIGKYEEAIDMLMANGKMTYSELYKLNNFKDIAKKADEYISNKGQRINLSFDWLMRFYESVGNISDEEMHDVWARLLAGELDNPGSYSYKTIEILKNMNKNDATMFKMVCDSSIKNTNQVFLPNYDEYLDNRNIKYIDVMNLNENGLIFNDGSITLNKTATKEIGALLELGDYVVTQISKNDSYNTQVKEFPFTKAGKEIYELLDVKQELKNIIDFAKEIQKKNSSVEIGVYKILERDGGRICFDNTNLIIDN